MERYTLEGRAFTHRLIINFKLNDQKDIPIYFNLHSTCLPLKNIYNVYIITTRMYSYAIRFNHSFLRKMSCLRPKNGVVLIEPNAFFYYSK